MLSKLGALLDGEMARQVLDSALITFEAALEVWEQQNLSYRWAKTQQNIAVLTISLFYKTADTRYLNKGIAAVESALTIFHEMNSEYDIGKAEHVLDLLKKAQG